MVTRHILLLTKQEKEVFLPLHSVISLLSRVLHHIRMVLLTIFSAILGTVSAIIFLIYWKLIRPQKRLYDIYRKQGVSCEPFVPLFGQLADMRRAGEKNNSMNYRLELVRKHGYVYGIGFGPTMRLIIIEPDMVADVFGRSHAQDYRKPIGTDQFFKPLIGVRNLLVSEGVEHERARKILNPAFHFVKLQSMIPIMAQQTHKAIDELLSSSGEQVVDLHTEFNALTLTIIASAAFGKGFETIEGAKQIVCRAFTELLEAIDYRSMRMIDRIPIISQLPFWRKDIVEKDSRAVSDFVDQIIADRRQKRSTSSTADDDLLDLLLSAVDSEGQPFDDQEIKDQALTFVLAGHETTSNLMTWAMYVLMTNEKVLRAC